MAIPVTLGGEHGKIEAITGQEGQAYSQAYGRKGIEEGFLASIA